MTSNAAGAAFGEWAQEREQESQQSELENANAREEEEVSRFEDTIAHDLEKNVEDYALQYMRDISGFESSLEQAYPRRAAEQQQQQQQQPHESDSKVSSDPEQGAPIRGDTKMDKKLSLCERATAWSHKLNHTNKNLIRHAIVTVAGLLMPYFPLFRQYAGSLTNLIPVYALILTLRPLQNTCVGSEIHHVLVFICMWPFVYAYAVFMVVVTADNLGGYLVFQGLGILVLVFTVWTHPASLPAIVVQMINFSIVVVAIYAANNFASYDDPFGQSITILNNATFAMSMPFALHLFGALLIFPWLGTTQMQKALGTRFDAYASLLRRIRPVYDRIAVYTLDPLDDSKYDHSCVDVDTLKSLCEARAQEVNSIPLAQRWLEATLVETRYLFNGEGLRYLDRYKISLKVSRIARSAATDILGVRDKDYEGLVNDLHLEKDLLQKQAGLLNLTLDETEQKQRKAELTRIPVLMTEISLLLELGAHRLSKIAKGRPLHLSPENIREVDLLDKEVRMLERLADELEGLALSWTKRYIKMHAAIAYDHDATIVTAFFRRIKVINYAQVLLKLVKLHKETLLTLQHEIHPRPDDWIREWKLTFPFVDQLLSTAYAAARSALYIPTGGWLGRIEERAGSFFSESRFKGALKYAVGVTLLSVPGMVASSYSVYSTVQLVNAIFTFQVVLMKSQEGLILERSVQRVAGIAMGIVVAGIAWELACIGGCTADYHEWVFFAFEIAILALYLYAKTVKPAKAYVVYATLRTLASMLVSYLTSSEPTARKLWIQGGYVFASSLIGAAGALFLALFIWPVSGRFLIRETLAQTYHDFVLLFEQVLTERFRDPGMTECDSPKVNAFEDQIASTLYVDMALKLRSAELESKQQIRFDAPHEDYVKAVESTRRIWHALWKLHHLGGVRVYMRDRKGNSVASMSASTARGFFAANRWLTSAFTAISARLASQRRDSLPVLRPLAASPWLLNEMVHQLLAQAYHDQTFLDFVLASNDLSLLINLPLLAQNLIIISDSLDVVYNFMEHFLKKPAYGDELRRAEEVSYNLFSHSAPNVAVM
ncbi:Hypothetical Protein FCC1311_032642 [Hondaea fermentalgiana]|uniref:DUF2421 domain-containing protein n=1 Tax=Hondaea fermentalgiana TaxID=2315210 RepID=A0A2R5GFM7_9STRA|nr:Hypothetical Protein FCC1311_032642 [Hondaea fermentalgiana]|eukprot:GBG27041.1 Hypothetical Protein FCC1311_032642 [Hondaea fermentalgiana]